ncbi:MAG: Rne/Rng family ribonuclease [Bdellovibrionales bacterium]|nr:Rne/Rng family ribonuclease [Bdellovibrionales bacterium]
MLEKSKILISAQPSPTRAVHLKGDSVIQFIANTQPTLVGSIYKGKVTKVLPGMGACFVNIGLERDCFLYVKELLPFKSEDGVEQKPNIQDIKVNQMILVQIIKDPISTKGPRISMQISLPTPYLIYMPYSSGIGISKKIEDEEERERIISHIKQLKPEGGVIVRTKAEGRSDFKKDLNNLKKLWKTIQKKQTRKTVGLVHREISPEIQMIRDELHSLQDQVWIDNKEIHSQALTFVKEFMPEFKKNIKIYDKTPPLFEKFNIEKQLSHALSRTVYLKSGGSIVIDENEALVSIDVNTSKFSGKKSQETNILKTNLEAVKEISKQLRIRNCGGIIVIDLIDMSSKTSKTKVMKQFEQELEQDRAYTEIVSLSPLNVIQMTRKRTRPSLRASLCRPCALCEGQGWIKSPHTVSCELFRSIQNTYGDNKGLWKTKSTKLQVFLHPSVHSWIQENEGDHLSYLKKKYRITLQFKEDQTCSPAHFEFDEL